MPSPPGMIHVSMLVFLLMPIAAVMARGVAFSGPEPDPDLMKKMNVRHARRYGDVANPELREQDAHPSS